MKISIPVGMHDIVVGEVARIAAMQKKAYRDIGEAFGLGAADFSSGREWAVRMNLEERLVYLVEGESGEPMEDTVGKSLDDILEPMASLDMADRARADLIVTLRRFVPKAAHQSWSLNFVDMTLDITTPEYNLENMVAEGVA